MGVTLWVTAHGSCLGLDVERPWSALGGPANKLSSYLVSKGCISDTVGGFILDGRLLVECPDYNVESWIMSWCG